MDSSALGLIEDLDHIAFSDDHSTEFCMTILTQKTPEIGLASGSRDLERSISNAVERNLSASEMDLFEACREGDINVLRTLLDENRYDINQLNDCGLAALHQASRSNQREAIELLINHGADLNIISSMENKLLTPLHFAAWFNSTEAVECLIQKGADVESSSAFGQKPLHYAVARAGMELVKTLLTEGKANPNGVDHQNFSPLHLATQRGRLDIIKILFTYGADLQAKNDESETAIHLATKEGRNEILRHLLRQASMAGVSCKDVINSENHEGSNCLQLAVQGGHVEAAMICIEHGADPHSARRDSLPLHVASSLGDFKMAKFLLSHDHIHVDEEDSEGMTPILRASLSGNVEIIELLITKGASVRPPPGFRGPSPLMCAVKRGHHKAMILLLQRGSPIDFRDSYHRTCLHVAAHSGNEDTVDIILKNGGKDLINSADKDNRTPLHYAASKGSLQTVKKLLDAGSDVNIKDDEEKLPIHMASESGNLGCVKVLLEANPKSLHSVEYTLRTPIHYAAFEGHLSVVKFLLEQGSNVDQKDENHLTPLMLASRANHYRLVVILLDYGAKIGALSKNRNTALDVAAYFGHPRIVRLLLDRGASVTNKSVFGKGCLEAAIKGSRADTCMEIIKHKRWREAVEVKGNDGLCLMKQLLEKLPDVAKVVMDKCIETSDLAKTDPNYYTSFNFELLDPGPGEQTNTEGIRYFGPKVMLKHGYKELILHPLTQELMRVKRHAFKTKFILAGALFHVFFTINLTFFLLCLNSFTIDAQHNATSSFSENVCTDNLTPSRTMSAAISGMSLLSHFYRIYVEKWSYWMDVSNILELFTFIAALISVTGREVKHDESFELTFAVLAVLLAYLTLLSYLQSLFKAGIYVTMMFEVLRTLLLVISVFFILLFGFALVFHALLSREANASRAGIRLNQTDEDPFGRIDLALLKVMDMMIGELEYNAFFVDNTLYLPDLTRFMFAMFCVLTPIVFMNLLIGLAVGDIESIQRNAELKLLAIEIEDVYTFERRLPKCILRRFHKLSITKYPNKTNCGWRKGFTNVRRMISGMKDNSSLDEVTDDAFEQTAVSFFQRLAALEQKVDKLSTNIETQNEMLEKFVKILGAKENEDTSPNHMHAMDARL